MVKLSNLSKIVDKKKKRLGRGVGSGKGSNSGRGRKGAKKRGKINLWFEGGQNPQVKKYPLLRGKAKNKSVRKKHLPVTLDQLNKLAKESEVTAKLLVENKIVDKKALKVGVKILTGGEINIPLTVKLPASASAKKKIEKAGGKVVER